MKYLYSWLRQHYPETPALDELEDLLIQLGHDVESIDRVTYHGVIVAEVTNLSRHPNADRLSLVAITTGSETREVVCGAPNVVVGQKVAYAPVDTMLPTGLVLKPIKIRGTASDGMLCAADELGIIDDHTGLLNLPPEAKLGDPIDAYVPLDAAISLDITPNRGDVLSHYGLARDIKAAVAKERLQPRLNIPNYGQDMPGLAIDEIHPDTKSFNLAVTSTEGAMPTTPAIMQARLRRLDHKSINLATDITNYLLLEYGQPLHAYDYDKLGQEVRFGVRRAKNQESFIGLTGTTYTLTPQCLVITNNDHIIGLAGVMGGDATKTTSSTTKVVFEAANFHPKAVAIMARGLNLLTDSALHFERGVDPDLAEAVLAHAQAMWQNLTHGQAYRPISKIGTTPDQTIEAVISVEQARQFLGLTIDEKMIKAILRALGCSIGTQQSADAFRVSPPTWRFDLRMSVDYYEEIARIIGLQNIPKSPLPATVPQGKRTKFWRVEQLKDLLVSTGAYEIRNYPFVSDNDIAMTPQASEVLTLEHAPLEGRPYLRVSLIPGLLQALAANPETPFVPLFEIGKIYEAKSEPTMLGVVVGGNQETELDNWWRNFFERLRLPVASWMSRVTSLTPDEIQAHKLRKNLVTTLELSVDELITGKTFESPQIATADLESISYTPLAKFQASRRDIAFIVDAKHTADDIAKSLKALDPHIVEAELFDTYNDPRLGDNNRSLAFHIFYQAPDKTLTNEEIQTIHQNLENYIKEYYHGTIR